MPIDADNLKITLSGHADNIDAPSFISALKDALDVLVELDRSVSGSPSGSIDWQVIDASANSPLTIEFKGTPRTAGDFAPIVIGACLDGLEAFETGGQLPGQFNRSAEDSLVRLAKHFSNGLGRLELAAGNRRVVATSAVLERVAPGESLKIATTRSKSHYEIGEIEGRLDTVSSHQEYYFNLWDTLSDKRVRCTFPAHLRESVRAALGRRAIVRGRILYAASGKPQSIVVDDIRVKHDSASLPQFKDASIDITGGIESSTYIRGLRDDD